MRESGPGTPLQLRALLPAQQADYLGLELDSQTMFARLSLGRRETLLSLTRIILASQTVWAHEVRSVLGHMAAAHQVVQLGLLHMHSIQRWFN